MTENVISLGGVTRLDIPTDRVLEAAKSHCSEGVIVIGWDDDGSLYFASSMADGGEVLWLLEMCKKRLLEAGEDQ
jgi:hypothetical protein